MKIYQLKGFWPLILILLPVPVPGQDILYKKDSTILNVSIKEFDGRTIKFTNPADPAGKTWYLSKSVLDSLTFGGKTVNFPDNSPGTKLRTIKRNYLHSDMVNTMSGMINLDYERISGSGQTGFVAGILLNDTGSSIFFQQSCFIPYPAGKIEKDEYGVKDSKDLPNVPGNRINRIY